MDRLDKNGTGKPRTDSIREVFVWSLKEERKNDWSEDTEYRLC